MNVNYFFRTFHKDNISIEKLFNVIINEISRRGIVNRKVINPYDLSLFGIVRTLLYFRKNQGQINHITGDIHWSCLLLNSKRTVLTIHDIVGLNYYKGIKGKLYKLLWLQLPITKLKYITVISEKTKQEILDLVPSACHKISVIPNCLTVEIAEGPTERKNSIPKILIIGTRTNKNVERVLNAAKGLKVEFIIVGHLDLSLQNAIAENAIEYKCFENVTDQQLIQFYDICDMLCFVSLYEGFGLPILEAQARNCVVITSNISPMNEVAGNGALLVNPLSEVEIRNALLQCISDDNLCEKLISEGRENIKKYLPQKIANDYIDLYNNILENQ